MSHVFSRPIVKLMYVTCLQLTNSEALDELFTNVTWSDATAYLNVDEKEVLIRWAGPTNNVFLTLILFIVTRVSNFSSLLIGTSLINQVIQFDQLINQWCPLSRWHSNNIALFIFCMKFVVERYLNIMLGRSCLTRCLFC